LANRFVLAIYPVAAVPAIRFIALLGLCAAYLQGGLVKLVDFGGAVAEAQHFGLPFAPAIAGATIVIELVGSALILSGVYRWLGALGLAGFTLIATFVAMHRHYEEVATELSLGGLGRLPEFEHTVLVLIGDVHQGVVRAVQYAKTLAGPAVAVRAVYVETDPARTYRLEEKWAKCDFGVPLVVLGSPYRSLLRPLLEYVDQIQSLGDDRMVTIVLPEFLPRHWWQHVVHNQTALLVKGALLFRKNTVVADVPYLLKR